MQWALNDLSILKEVFLPFEGRLADIIQRYEAVSVSNLAAYQHATPVLAEFKIGGVEAFEKYGCFGKAFSSRSRINGMDGMTAGVEWSESCEQLTHALRYYMDQMFCDREIRGILRK